MYGADILLTDEYVEFTGKVAEIHSKKKDLKAAFEQVYADYKKNSKACDEEVVSLQAAFEEWCKTSKQATNQSK
jgi:phage host-nuclease inhibitor protein Gam